LALLDVQVVGVSGSERTEDLVRGRMQKTIYRR
jgi:hypothetical protein